MKELFSRDTEGMPAQKIEEIKTSFKQEVKIGNSVITINKLNTLYQTNGVNFIVFG